MPHREGKHIFSMTGYGRATAANNKHRVSVEIRAVNGRFLEIRQRLPRSLLFLEPILREIVSKQIKRGMLDVSVTVHPLEVSEIAAIDEKLLEVYHKKVQQLAERFDVSSGTSISSLLRLPGVITNEEHLSFENDAEVKELVKECLGLALTHLIESRSKEGEKLGKALLREVENIQKHRDWIFKHREDINKKYFNKLETRLKDWASKHTGNIDETRLLQEMVFYVDRSDVTEEIDRLGIHLKQCEEILATHNGSSSLGKRLDFLAQELGREVNTIGSKSDQAQIANHVVEMKLSIEKLREQVQNLE